MSQCWGRTPSLRRCRTPTGGRWFCHQHRYQPLKWLWALVFTAAAGISSILSFLNISLVREVSTIEEAVVRQEEESIKRDSTIPLELPAIQIKQNELDARLKEIEDNQAKLSAIRKRAPSGLEPRIKDLLSQLDREKEKSTKAQSDLAEARRYAETGDQEGILRVLGLAEDQPIAAGSISTEEGTQVFEPAKSDEFKSRVREALSSGRPRTASRGVFDPNTGECVEGEGVCMSISYSDPGGSVAPEIQWIQGSPNPASQEYVAVLTGLGHRMEGASLCRWHHLALMSSKVISGHLALSAPPPPPAPTASTLARSPRS